MRRFQLGLVSASNLERHDAGNGVEVRVNMQDCKTPGLRCCGDEEVDHRGAFVLAQVDESVLGALHEAPRVVGHWMPSEERAKLSAKLIAVSLTAGCPDQFGLDDRADTDSAGANGVDPSRLDLCPATETNHHGCVGKERHAACPL
jgi:hypothetical protein